MSIICKTCGATVSDDETHCPYCDSLIEKPINESQKHQIDTAYGPYNSANNNEAIPINTPKAMSNSKFYALVVLSFLIPIVGWVLYFVYREDHPSSAKAFSEWAWCGLIFTLLLKYVF